MNPAIDASCAVQNVFPDHKLRCGPVLHEPGGGGINVSRAIQNLGGQSTVFYLAGGPSGQMFGVLLDREGLKHLAISIGDWTRENFTVTEDASGQQYRFIVPGPSVRTKDARNATLPTRRCGAIICADYRVIPSARERMGPKEQEISPLYIGR